MHENNNPKHNEKNLTYADKTRSSKSTKIAYFPVNLILKVRIVGSRNRLSNDRRTENRTDRRKQFF